MRAYHKGWQSDRPMKKGTRRVRWYQQNEPLSIRLHFEDQLGGRNEFFTTVEAATAEYEKFIAGKRHALTGLDNVYEEVLGI